MQNDLDDWRDLNQQLLDTANETQLSLVELVLAVSECSEDESEIFDLVDDLVSTGRVQLTALHRDSSANA